MFEDKHRLEYLKEVARAEESEESLTYLAKPEEEWCATHNLSPAALKNISDIYDDVMKQLHRFRPSFLVKINPPRYIQPSEFNHTCRHHEILELEDKDTLSLEDRNPHYDSQRKCSTTPYVSQTDFGTAAIVETLNTLVKEIKMQRVAEKTVPKRGPVSNRERRRGAYVQPALETEICVFFANGSCYNGPSCRFSHSSSAPKPVCKFFLTLQGCRNGSSCSYSHDCGSLMYSSITSGISSQEGRSTSLCCTKLLPADGNRHILIMNDRSLEFSKKLCQYYDACKIVACTPSVQSTESDSVPRGLKILRNLSDPSLLIIGREHKLPVPWSKVQRVFWFADFDNDESTNEQVLLQKFLEHMSIKILSEPLFDLQVILIMKNTKFIYLQAERMARECFFFLSESFLFDEATLGWFSDIGGYPRGMQVSAPVVYVFTMHRPTVTQFGYPEELRKALRRDWPALSCGDI